VHPPLEDFLWSRGPIPPSEAITVPETFGSNDFLHDLKISLEAPSSGVVEKVTGAE
jgi:hypothetical protein